ncbi:his operon leader peptide [Enterobacteriaceae bacterium ESL0689]|nr:his operon leader peptide [Enterobacteriaceae bacterium ESL0689]
MNHVQFKHHHHHHHPG